jgi:hypothetical protein
VQLSISSHSAAIPRQGADTKPEAGYGKPVNSVSMLILKDVIEACAYVVMAFLPKSGLEVTQYHGKPNTQYFLPFAYYKILGPA